MLYVLYRIGQGIVLILPLRIAYGIADILGSLYYLLAKNDRKIAADNLKVILNHHSSRRKPCYLSRMVFVNFARYLVDFLRTPKLDIKYLQRQIAIQGRENLDAAFALGRGVLLISAHIGNWELGAIFLSLLGYKINAVVWTHKVNLINEFFLRQRRSKGVKIIPLGTAIRNVFRVLNNNEGVALLGDIDFANPQSGVRVKLFGQDTTLPKGPAQFSLKLGCPIVCTFVLREKGNRFNLILEKPLLYQASGDREKDVLNLTQAIAQKIEFHIAQHPSQWFMLTPRW